MIKARKYFDSTGRQVNEHDAFDARGVLKDKHTMRIPMMVRDGLSELQRSVRDASNPDAKRKLMEFTDGRGTNDPTAGCRPGFRIPTVHDRAKVRDAYEDYEKRLVNRYKAGDGETLCPQCLGEDYVNSELCTRCSGDGTVDESDFDTDDNKEGSSVFGSNNGFGNSTDSQQRTNDQRRKVIDKLYEDRDAELRNAWKNPQAPWRT
jgi:hypothetical protein